MWDVKDLDDILNDQNYIDKSFNNQLIILYFWIKHDKITYELYIELTEYIIRQLSCN